MGQAVWAAAVASPGAVGTCLGPTHMSPKDRSRSLPEATPDVFLAPAIRPSTDSRVVMEGQVSELNFQ